MGLLELNAEIRLRIYEYAFGDTTVRFTRPKTGSRARVYAVARQNLGLLTSCKFVYLEAHPLYVSLIRLVLKNTVVDDVPEYLKTTILPQIEYLEIDCDRHRHFNVEDVFSLHALKQLKITTLGPEHLFGVSSSAPSFNLISDCENYFDGLEDSQLMQGQRLKYEAPRPDLRWAHPVSWIINVYKDPRRQFKILDTLRINFQSRRAILELIYDVDTFTVAERVLQDKRSWKKKVWKNGKVKTYTLKRNGAEGILRKTEDWL